MQTGALSGGVEAPLAAFIELLKSPRPKTPNPSPGEGSTWRCDLLRRTSVQRNHLPISVNCLCIHPFCFVNPTQHAVDSRQVGFDFQSPPQLCNGTIVLA